MEVDSMYTGLFSCILKDAGSRVSVFVVACAGEEDGKKIVHVTSAFVCRSSAPYVHSKQVPSVVITGPTTSVTEMTHQWLVDCRRPRGPRCSCRVYLRRRGGNHLPSCHPTVSSECAPLEAPLVAQSLLPSCSLRPIPSFSDKRTTSFPAASLQSWTPGLFEKRSAWVNPRNGFGHTEKGMRYLLKQWWCCGGRRVGFWAVFSN